MGAKSQCSKCGRTLQRCGVCKGSGKVWGMFGGCTECKGTGYLCNVHGGRH